MAKRRKVSNLLALALLVLVARQPMHPYEMATTLRAMGKEQDLNIRWGSLYTVVANLEKHGYFEATGVTREGNRPARTVYRVTEAGEAEAHDWLRELISRPEREYPPFRTALGLVSVLDPDEVVDLLTERLTLLDAETAAGTAELAAVAETLPRLFLIEAEYQLTVRRAEADWVRGLITEIQTGTMNGLSEWREFHRTGEPPAEMVEMLARHMAEVSDGSQVSDEDA
jgi:DNA-binding PadR family transcriptional regulator